MNDQLQRKLKTLHQEEQEQQAQRLAKKSNLPYLDLRILPIEQEAIATLLEKEARKNGLAVIARIGKKLKIGLTNPKKAKLVLNKLKGFNINFFVISQASLDKALGIYQSLPQPAKKTEVEIESQDLKKFQAKIKNIAELQERIKEVPTTEIINIILAGALQTKATDIHIESTESALRLRYRLDGLLTDIAFLSKQAYESIISRIKLLSKLKLNITNVPQNGSFVIKEDNNKIDVRVSTLPGPAGESIVLRILNPAIVMLDLKQLGLEEDYLGKIKKALKKPNGMILNTGPTGCGKTTTLYACLMEIHKPGIKIITLEDPIEYKLAGITQTQIDEKKDYTFALGLKNALRQDPDVILVGEIRDAETAATALNAALTGHIVLSTLHTNNSAGAIPRLIDMGIKPFVIAPAINLIIAQRLVRKKGGGRIGIFELFEIDEQMEKLILSTPPTYKIKDLAIKSGMRTMYEDGMIKVKKGITTKEEVEKVTVQ
ncbi:MAG: GspE/PulE family protein [bacterium]